MTLDRRQRIQRLYQAALERPPAQRLAFLVAASQGDDALRHEVSALLTQEQTISVESLLPSGPGDASAADPAPPRSGSAPFVSAGTLLGPYRIEEQIGSGGMGQVFRAVDTRLNRTVAIKISSQNFDAHFEREARTIAQLNHPHICTLHDVGPNFLVMEMLEGETLAARLRRGPLPIEQVLRYGAQVADALASAHSRGIVHRDLKPANIMTTKARAKVLDFGIARCAHDEVLTAHGDVIGTPAYMSPEQRQGSECDARSDIWSLGLVLREMATGSRTGSLKCKPSHFAHVVARCLEFDPEDRWQAASDVRQELEWAATHRESEPLHQSDEDRGGDIAGSTENSTATATSAHIPPPAEGSDAVPGSEPGEPGPVAAGATHELENPPSSGNRAARRARSSRWSMAAAAALVLVLVSGTVIWRMRLAAAPPSKIRSIAVMPLENLSKDPGQTYFADGTTDALITDLSKLGALKVISLSSAMRYKGTRKTLPEIARELQVDAIVEGSVIQADGRVRISARLTRAVDGHSLWAENFVRDLKEVLSLQDEVARQIAGKIELTLTPEEQSRLTEGPVMPEAYQLYLQAQFAFNQDSVSLRKQAIDLFAKAVQKDPNYSRAYAMLALTYASLGRFYEEPNIVMPKARQAALKAISLDETLSEAHTALATVRLQYDWDWEGAETELKRAIRLNRSSADAHDLYAAYYTALGNFKSALAEIELAREVDPLSLRYADRFLYVFVFFRDYNRAIAEANAILAKNPDFVMGYAWKAMAFMMQGRLDEALQSQKRAFDIDPNPGMKVFLATVEAARGDKAEAARLIRQVEAASRQQYVCNYEIAQAYAAMGDRDESFKWLNTGVKQQCDCMIWLKGEPWMDNLRADPRYLDMLKRVGFDRLPASAKR